MVGGCSLSINLNLSQNGVEGRQPPIGARGDSPRSTAPSRGEGVGVRDREFVLLIKKIDFFDSLKPPTEWSEAC